MIAFGIYNEAAQGNRLDAQVGLLQQQNAALQQQIQDRQREIAEAQTAAWLENEARKLGYVLPGEKIYVITPPGSSPPSSGGVSAPLPSFEPIATPTPTPRPTPAASSSPSPTPETFTVPAPSPAGH